MSIFKSAIRSVSHQSARLSSVFGDHVRHTKLKNHIDVVSQRRFQDKRLRFFALIKVGSFDDFEGKEGIAHFLEHVLFTHETFQEFRRRRGFVNANTNSERVVIEGFVENTLENLDYVLSELKRMLTEPIQEDVFEREKRRIHNELNIYLDQAQSVHAELLGQAFKKGRSHRNIGGAHDTVDATSIDDLNRFKKLWFTGPGIFLAFSGISNHQKFHDLLETKLEDVPDNNSTVLFQPVFEPREVRELGESVHQLYFSFDFPLEPLSDRQQKVATIAWVYLNDLLREEIIHKEGIVYHIEQDRYHDHERPGVFSIIGNVMPEDGDKVIRLLSDVLAKSAMIPNPAGIHMAKAIILDNIEEDKSILPFVLRKVDDMCPQVAFSQRVETLVEREREFQSISPEEVKNFIRRAILNEPALIAYGDSSKLQPKDAFVSMLRQAMARHAQCSEEMQGGGPTADYT